MEDFEDEDEKRHPTSIDVMVVEPDKIPRKDSKGDKGSDDREEKIRNDQI